MPTTTNLRLAELLLGSSQLKPMVALYCCSNELLLERCDLQHAACSYSWTMIAFVKGKNRAVLRLMHNLVFTTSLLCADRSERLNGAVHCPVQVDSPGRLAQTAADKHKHTVQPAWIPADSQAQQWAWASACHKKQGQQLHFQALTTPSLLQESSRRPLLPVTVARPSTASWWQLAAACAACMHSWLALHCL